MLLSWESPLYHVSRHNTFPHPYPFVLSRARPGGSRYPRVETTNPHLPGLEPYQQEMGIPFSRGDELSATASKATPDAEDVIGAPELGKGTDTLLSGDHRGNRVWKARADKGMHGSRAS